MAVTSLVGYIGIFRENKAYLTIYNILFWPLLIGIVLMGYISYYNVMKHQDGGSELLDNLWEGFTAPQKLLFQKQVSARYQMTRGDGNLLVVP
jgi:hypothetical protein